MKKAIVVGCGAGSKMAHEITKECPDSEIIFYEKADEVPIPERGLVITECHKFTATPRCEMPFIPRLPKGHKRPYKYHR